MNTEIICLNSGPAVCHCRIAGSVISRFIRRLQQGQLIWPQWHWNISIRYYFLNPAKIKVRVGEDRRKRHNNFINCGQFIHAAMPKCSTLTLAQYRFNNTWTVESFGQLSRFSCRWFLSLPEDTVDRKLPRSCKIIKWIIVTCNLNIDQK